MPTLAPPAYLAATRRDDVWLIGLVSLAHGTSHFAQLLLPPLFPWLKVEFAVNYAQLGALLTIFFIVSCVVQAFSGFWVDKHGPRPVLFAGLGLLVLAAAGFASSTSYAALAACAVVAGLGNGVFHPVDYTLINRIVAPPRVGHAYSSHGISGNLGWALAPALLAPLALAYSWRVALWVAVGFAAAVWLLLWAQRERLVLPVLPAASKGGKVQEGGFDFLRIPAVWVCFAFFLFFAMVLSGIQAFAPEAARQLHDVPLAWVAQCLTIYMVCAALGMVGGGFLASNPAHSERMVALGIAVAACVALTLAFASLPAAAVPVLFGVMGLASGSVSPARDMLVKRSTPANASGRVYGVVYSGLDIGQAIAPLLFGRLMDLHQPQSIWIGIAAFQLLLITTAFQVHRVRRES